MLNEKDLRIIYQALNVYDSQTYYIKTKEVNATTEKVLKMREKLYKHKLQNEKK